MCDTKMFLSYVAMAHFLLKTNYVDIDYVPCLFFIVRDFNGYGLDIYCTIDN